MISFTGTLVLFTECPPFLHPSQSLSYLYCTPHVASQWWTVYSGRFVIFARRPALHSNDELCLFSVSRNEPYLGELLVNKCYGLENAVYFQGLPLHWHCNKRHLDFHDVANPENLGALRLKPVSYLVQFSLRFMSSLTFLAPACLPDAQNSTRCSLCHAHIQFSPSLPVSP